MGLRGASGGLMLLATLIVAAVGAGAAVVTLSDRFAGARNEAPTPTVEVPPFTVPGDGAELRPVARIGIQVVASSALAPDGPISYGPENTLDGDETTAWNSDAPADEGRGESLTYRFSEPIDLRAVQFVNGYDKTPEIYTANHRVKELRIVTDASAHMVSLIDTSDDQAVTFDFGLTSKVTLEIVDVYPGAGFDDPELDADLALSEVRFLAAQRP